MTPTENLRKRLLYQSQHRGMREMDIVLGGFARKKIETLSPQELEQFEALLAFPDQHLYGWFFERAPLPESAPFTIVEAILTFIESR